MKKRKEKRYRIVINSLIVFSLFFSAGCSDNMVADNETFYGIEYQKPEQWVQSFESSPKSQWKKLVSYDNGGVGFEIARYDITDFPSFSAWLETFQKDLENSEQVTDILIREVSVDGMPGAEFTFSFKYEDPDLTYKNIITYLEREQGEVYGAGYSVAENEYPKGKNNYKKMRSSIKKADQIQIPDSENFVWFDTKLRIDGWSHRYQWADSSQLFWTDIQEEKLSGALLLRVKSEVCEGENTEEVVSPILTELFSLMGGESAEDLRITQQKEITLSETTVNQGACTWNENEDGVQDGLWAAFVWKKRIYVLGLSYYGLTEEYRQAYMDEIIQKIEL